MIYLRVVSPSATTPVLHTPSSLVVDRIEPRQHSERVLNHRCPVRRDRRNAVSDRIESEHSHTCVHLSDDDSCRRRHRPVDQLRLLERSLGIVAPAAPQRVDPDRRRDDHAAPSKADLGWREAHGRYIAGAVVMPSPFALPRHRPPDSHPIGMRVPEGVEPFGPSAATGSRPK